MKKRAESATSSSTKSVTLKKRTLRDLQVGSKKAGPVKGGGYTARCNSGVNA